MHKVFCVEMNENWNWVRWVNAGASLGFIAIQRHCKNLSIEDGNWFWLMDVGKIRTLSNGIYGKTGWYGFTLIRASFINIGLLL